MIIKNITHLFCVGKLASSRSEGNMLTVRRDVFLSNSLTHTAYLFARGRVNFTWEIKGLCRIELHTLNGPVTSLMPQNPLEEMGITACLYSACVVYWFGSWEVDMQKRKMRLALFSYLTFLYQLPTCQTQRVLFFKKTDNFNKVLV